jgi:Phosphodiester glycosidase
MSRWIHSIAGLGLIAISLSGMVGSAIRSSDSAAPIAASSPASPSPTASTIHYAIHSLPNSQVHTLLIPPGSFTVTPAVAATTQPLAAFVEQHTLAALNGGFFDPQNQQTTSYVVSQGQLVADPAQNERLVHNPDLAAYLDKILNRTEFRRYQCGQALQYDIAQHREPPPDGCVLLDALGAGPRLLPDLTLEQEGFTATDAHGTVIRDAIGSSQPNARTAIGITAKGEILWMMAAQQPRVTPSGASLPELANLMKTLGAVEAMNLDGGSSSALFYEGTTIHGKFDAQGNPVERPIKSVLLLEEL